MNYRCVICGSSDCKNITFLFVGDTNITLFDFSKQNTDSFKKWGQAFYESLLKRTKSNVHKCFVSFSSGHDSGLIAAELMMLKISFKAYVMTYLEDSHFCLRRVMSSPFF